MRRREKGKIYLFFPARGGGKIHQTKTNRRQEGGRGEKIASEHECTWTVERSTYSSSDICSDLLLYLFFGLVPPISPSSLNELARLLSAQHVIKLSIF